VLDDLPSLIWAANLADIELHTSLSLADEIERPAMVVFDLDPGDGAGVLQCARVAVRLRDLFAELGLETLVKTSGSKGLQAYVPLNTEVTYADTKPLAKAVAELLAKAYPEEVVARQTKQLRTGRVLVDWSQNDEHKTTINVYSLRARERPTVSTPLAWEELEAALTAGDADALVFDAAAVLARVERDGDHFAPALSLRQALPDVGTA
jgi:bifunctional non-homologous end joining protein LigD